MLLSQRADGAIVIPTRRGWSGRQAALANLPMPGILVDRRIEGLDLDSVTTDNVALGQDGMARAVRVVNDGGTY